VGRYPEGAVGPLGGASCLYEGHIYLDEIRAQLNIYIGRHFAWLKYCTYHLLLVPVLAANYKQEILSQAKVSFSSLSQHAD
jgi:hypothetical protein